MDSVASWVTMKKNQKRLKYYKLMMRGRGNAIIKYEISTTMISFLSTWKLKQREAINTITHLIERLGSEPRLQSVCFYHPREALDWD